MTGGAPPPSAPLSCLILLVGATFLLLPNDPTLNGGDTLHSERRMPKAHFIGQGLRVVSPGLNLDTLWL